MKPLCGKDYKVGASLRAWKEFFINANIFGLDIETKSLFEEDRIKCFLSDQSNENSLIKTIDEIKKYLNKNDISFDLIIDDGSHILNHQITSLITLAKFLNKNSFYIIEDINAESIPILLNISDKLDLKVAQVYQGKKFKQDCFIALEKS